MHHPHSMPLPEVLLCVFPVAVLCYYVCIQCITLDDGHAENGSCQDVE